VNAPHSTTGPTFGEFALNLFGHIENSFRNIKHREDWRGSLETYGGPICDMEISEVDTNAVLMVLRPIWGEIPEMADRVRSRIARVLDAAKAQGLRAGENPARWKGHLSLILPPKRKRSREPLPAMPYEQIPRFLSELRKREGVTPRMLELVVLLATASSETIAARCCEVDFAEAVWTIPASRTRSGKDHRVPLVGRALQIMAEACDGKDQSALVFPNRKSGLPMSNMALLSVLARMNRDDITVHGFRASFQNWAIDQTDFAEEIIDQALALSHLSYARPSRRPYRGRDTFEKRRDLMVAWDSYCTKTEAARRAKDDLIALSQHSDPHKRGKELERTLNALFAACGVLITEDFRRTGDAGGVVEQVDGVIEVDHELFLVEMKWWAEKISHAELGPHLSRLMLRSGVSGLFISNSGYTPSAIEAAVGFLNQRVLVLCTVDEIVVLLERGDDLIEFLRKKIRSARLERKPFKEIL